MVVSASFTAIDSFAGETQPISVAQSAVQLQEIRNATVKNHLCRYHVFDWSDAVQKRNVSDFKNTYRSELRNPLVDLPMSTDDVSCRGWCGDCDTYSI